MISSLRLVWTHRPSRAVALVFGYLSVFVGSWFARIPEVKTALGLSEAELGMVLLGMPVGTLLVMPLSGWLVTQWGGGPVAFGTAMLLGGTYLLLPTASNGIVLAGALGIAGMANGTLNVAMNARANVVEETRDVPIMSTCHGFFSLGGMIGAGLGSVTAALALPLEWHFVGLFLIGGAAVAVHRKALLTGPTNREVGPAFAMPSKALAGLAGLLFCVMVGEGAVSNWSAVYLRKGLGASAGLAGLGYAAFSGAMAVGRLHGDQLIDRFDTGRIVRGGAAIAAVGLGIMVVVAHPVAGIVGFFVQGIGFAVLVPVLYRSAARTPGMAPGSSIAAVATAGYVGLFAGPPSLGLVAEVWGLSWIIVLIAGLSAVVALLAGPVFRRSKVA